MNAKEVQDLNLTPIDQADDFAWVERRSLNGYPCIIGRISHKQPTFCVVESRSRPGIYTAVVYLDRYPGHEMWCDRQPLRLPMQDVGALSLYDRQHDWRSRVECPCECIVFHLPKDALTPASEEGVSWDIDMQGEPIRFGLIDPVMHYLTLALLPAFSRSQQVDEIYLDHLLNAVIAHLVQTYGRSGSPPLRECGRLAPWQIRRTKDLIAANLDGRIGVGDLADACRLSASHFTLLFKRTVGTTPHQWLLDRRIEQAKDLLRSSSSSLIDIAYATGFADQSHFARVFSQRVRSSPLAWRRRYAAKDGVKSSGTGGSSR
jgi:AraC family transcriptional regulator